MAKEVAIANTNDLQPLIQFTMPKELKNEKRYEL